MTCPFDDPLHLPTDDADFLADPDEPYYDVYGWNKEPVDPKAKSKLTFVSKNKNLNCVNIESLGIFLSNVCFKNSKLPLVHSCVSCSKTFMSKYRDM